MSLILNKYTNTVVPPKSKHLAVGDFLHAPGSWNVETIIIEIVTDDEAISSLGFRFKRDFTDGQSYTNRDIPFFLDYQEWYLGK